MATLPSEFYERPVVEVARALIGCTLRHGPTSGLIVETEAYHDSEPACHAFVGLTARTEPLFGEPGNAYVYRSYGIHALFNAVCEPIGVGAAVLIRSLAPLEGIELMRARRGLGRRGGLRRGGAPELAARDLCSGPGKLTQALAIGLELNRSSLVTGPVRLEERSRRWRREEIRSGPRIGITKAMELPWRFWAEGDVNVSGPRGASGARGSSGPGRAEEASRSG